MKSSLYCLIPLVLTGCSTTVDDPFLKTSAVSRDAPALARSVSPELALATIPLVGGSATSVRQTVRKNYAEQTIVYSNATDLSGDNALTVRVGEAGSEKGFTRAPSQGELQSEMAGVLTGVRMTISQVIGDNAYGSFGYATGPAGRSGTCVYAWQLARNIGAHDGAGFATIGGSRYAAQVRLRYCAPLMSVEQAVGLISGLRLKPVTAQTLEALGSSADVGVAAASSVPFIQPVSLAQPVVEQAAIAAEPMGPVRKRVRRLATPVIVEETPSGTTETEDAGIQNSVKVPMPGEAAADAGKRPSAASKAVPTETVIAKPSLIPLPGAVAAKQ